MFKEINWLLKIRRVFLNYFCKIKLLGTLFHKIYNTHYYFFTYLIIILL
jgi:hypothetical protein